MPDRANVMDLENDPSLPRAKPAFDQDPHRVRELSERNLEMAIGRSVRAFRRQQGMTVADLAGATGLSIGGVSPLAHATAPVTLIDRDLFRFGQIWAAAGHPHAVFGLQPQNLVDWTAAPVADVTVISP